MKLLNTSYGLEGWLTEDVTEHGNTYHIKDFPVYKFAIDVKRRYRTTRINKLFDACGISFFGKKTLIVHKFFVPELMYLLNLFEYPTSITAPILRGTWYGNKFSSVDRCDMSLVKKNIDVTLKPYQEEFVKNYDILKQKQELFGYILSFDQGLGKTLTSLCVMESIGVDTVVVIAPKTTIHTVWTHHINTFYKKPQSTWIVGEELAPSNRPKFIIANYESLTKLKTALTSFNPSANYGVIVDESHNFLRTKSIRTQEVIEIRKLLKCSDVLLMSGTPVKALGVEIIPLLHILDPYFDKDAEKKFKLAFGVNSEIATDVIHARLSGMMHRKTKEEVESLPSKIEHVVKIKLPNGDDYTEDVVKQKVLKYSDERLAYHRNHMSEYEKEFKEVVTYLRKVNGIGNTLQFENYLKTIEWLHSTTYTFNDHNTNKEIQELNVYEKTVLMPALTPELKKKFEHCRSSIKYVHLKVMGEVIGNFLTSLRTKMTTELVQKSNIPELIDTAFKKTVIFTSYVDGVEVTNEYLSKKKYQPIMVYGKTSGDVKSLLNRFTNDKKINPLIATIQSLATGVTLTVANTVIFLNSPWRDSDFRQASDRVHRIGQDTEVHIYTIVLDTGSKNNLSTRMEDILSWSRSQFEAIVTGIE